MGTTVHRDRFYRKKNPPTAQSCSEVLRESIEFAVVDGSDPDSSITLTKVDAVIDAMAGTFLKSMRENIGPVSVYQTNG